MFDSAGRKLVVCDNGTGFVKVQYVFSQSIVNLTNKSHFYLGTYI